MAVEFWFEFACTYSYPAALRIEALAQSQGVPVVWKPFLLAPCFARKAGPILPSTFFRRKDVTCDPTWSESVLNFRSRSAVPRSSRAMDYSRRALPIGLRGSPGFRSSFAPRTGRISLRILTHLGKKDTPQETGLMPGRAPPAGLFG
jgi:hypothetical protein